MVVRLGPQSHAWGSCPWRNPSGAVGVPGWKSGSRMGPRKTPTNASQMQNSSSNRTMHTNQLNSSKKLYTLRIASYFYGPPRTGRGLGETDVTIRPDWTGSSWGPPFMGGASAKPGGPPPSMCVDSSRGRSNVEKERLSKSKGTADWTFLPRMLWPARRGLQVLEGTVVSCWMVKIYLT